MNFSTQKTQSSQNESLKSMTFICRSEILRYIVVMKMCYDFFSKYFILKLDMKSFVFTSFHVCGDVLNTQNKVLNLNTSLEEVLLVPAF